MPYTVVKLKAKKDMTPAVQQLKKTKISFTLHQYHHDASASSFGDEVVEKLALNSKQVFKTLVVSDENTKLAVAIVPTDKKLNMKAMAKALKVKKVTMAEAKLVEASTGYVLGGVSPLGQKKRLTTVIDSSAQSFDNIYVSGGKRGLEIELSSNDIAKQTNACFADITT